MIFRKSVVAEKDSSSSELVYKENIDFFCISIYFFNANDLSYTYEYIRLSVYLFFYTKFYSILPFNITYTVISLSPFPYRHSKTIMQNILSVHNL